MRGREVAAATVVVAAALVSVAEPAAASCGLFSRHPCEPVTVCSVFHRGVCIPDYGVPLPQDLRLTIETTATTAEPPATVPDAGAEHQLNTIRAMFDALRACWVPPAESEARTGTQMSVRFAFKRSGEIIATPRVTYVSPGVSPDTREVYLQAVLRRSSGARRSTSPTAWPASRLPFASSTTAYFKGIPMATTDNTLVLDTTQGKVVIEMRPDLAPGHVARIKELVREGFYDGIVFHRVIDGFMAQTGCPHGTGTGGSGKKLKAEFNREKHVRGTVSMARAQSPDSGDSQFFICFEDAPFLNGQYTVWGKVTEGMENVDKIKRGEPVSNPDKIITAKMAADA
jgi:peptidylprolyl isomerase